MRFHCRRSTTWIAVAGLLVLAVSSVSRTDDSRSAAPAGWTMASPRDEIRPQFSYTPDGGRSGKGCFVITGDQREGTTGHWTRTFSIEGGQHYRFVAWRK